MDRQKYEWKKTTFVKRALAVILSFFMVFGMASFTDPVEVQAMTTQNEAVNWIISQKGRTIDADGVYGAQCVDLILAYFDYLGVSRIFGNAKDYAWKNPPAGWQRIQGASIQAGDIVIWTGGEYGHIALAISNNKIVEQNYNYHKYCEENFMRQNNYWGVWRPNFNAPAPVGYNPEGTLDNAEGGMNTVHVRGWAFDRDDVAQSIAVHVYIGGPAGVGEGHAITANVCREDVNNVFGVGICHGYDATIRTSLSGTQTVYVYAINVGGGTGNPQIGEKTVTISKDTTAPTISDVQVVDMDATGFTVTCRAEDAEGIAKVQFPTWTLENGQDDLAEGWWDNPNCRGTQDGTTWSFRVNDRDHNYERGTYRTHIYAYDNNGNATCYELNSIEFQNTYHEVNTASYSGHIYKLYNDILAWDEAKAKCEELGGHLVTITSADEQETVAGLIQGQERSYYWIGGSSDNGSKWVTGEEFSYSNWKPGEPNADGGEDCYHIYTDLGTWNDLLGSSKYLGFICEWEKLPHTHDYEEAAWKSNAETHWKECECGEKSEEAEHGFAWIIDAPATEESEGIKHEECGTCGYKRNIGTVIEKLPSTHTHDYGMAAWKTDAESHWKECECGEKAENAAHQFSWVIDIAATEDSTGLKHEECETCGYERNMGTIIEKLHTDCDHVYEANIIPATTQDDGSFVETCSKCGDEKNKTIIYAANNLSLSKTSYTYNGKEQKPSVTVKDSAGKVLKNNVDYTVSFPKGMKNVGRYTVTVVLKGNYSGTISKTFDIVPKGTSISRVTAKKKGFTVKWKKQKKQTTGYEIAYSTSSKFAQKSTKAMDAGKSKATSKTVSKLKAKKKYYVRIRTYKTVKINGKLVKLYSDWSKAKAVTTKK